MKPHWKCDLCKRKSECYEGGVVSLPAEGELPWLEVRTPLPRHLCGECALRLVHPYDKWRDALQQEGVVDAARRERGL